MRPHTIHSPFGLLFPILQYVWGKFWVNNHAHIVKGKKFDEDGVYGCQCVDGFKHFCRTELGLQLGSICYPTGYATSIWDNFEDLGLDKYFDKVASDQMVDGDWTIWSYDKKNRSCPYSHVAMFRKDNGNGTGIFLGQNQNGHPEFTQVNIYYDGEKTECLMSGTNVYGGLSIENINDIKENDIIEVYELNEIKR